MSNLLTSYQSRFAAKNFDPSKKITDTDLEMLIQSLILTPSSFGLQPWHFVVVSSLEIKQKLQTASWDQPQVGNCSHLFVLCARTNLSQNDGDKLIQLTADNAGIPVENLGQYASMISGFLSSKSTEELTNWSQKQVYIALGFLMSMAASLGLDSCPMEGFDPNSYNEILDLNSQGLTATLVFPVGYRSDEKYANQKKTRYSKNELVTLVE